MSDEILPQTCGTSTAPFHAFTTKHPISPEKSLLNNIKGSDTDGKPYDSTASMWNAELHGDLYDKKTGWYGKALQYWENTPANMSGVLGGLEEVHPADILETKKFLLEKLDHKVHEHTRALDCAAGIGRVSKSVLAGLYEKVDLLEPLPHLLKQAQNELAGNERIGKFILGSMETVELSPHTYDLIVIQWAVIYLTDDDFVRFFAHCKAALRPHGYIFLKDNVASTNAFLVDKEDSSLTRSDTHYKLLFELAGVKVKAETFQKDWRKDLLPVKMYALQ